ncbi:MAG: hypothetical protein ABUL62_24500 [Myxococcales bacterium]
MGILKRQLGFGALFLAAVGCVPTFDDNLPLVQKPIVLSVQSEPAEAAPNTQVQLTALVATPDVDGAAPAVAWGLCIARKPLTELGPVNPICIQPPGAAKGSILPLGSGATVTATLPADACRLFGPSLPEAMNGEPPGRPVDPDPTGGFYQPIGVTLDETGVTSLGAVRIFCPPSGLDQELGVAFNTNYRNNQNPTLDSIAVVSESGKLEPIPAEPDTLRVSRAQTLQFRTTWAACPTTPKCGDGICGALEDRNSCADDCTVPKGCTGAEPYTYFNPDSRLLESRHETIRVSWFATGGRFENAVTGRDEDEFSLNTTDNTWSAPDVVGKVRAWLVVRDARGGQSFRSFLLDVR